MNELGLALDSYLAVRRALGFKLDRAEYELGKFVEFPLKRFDRNLVCFLTRTEADALIEASNRNSWNGARDHALLLTMSETGLRVSELINLKYEDISFESIAQERALEKTAPPNTKPGRFHPPDKLLAFLERL